VKQSLQKKIMPFTKNYASQLRMKKLIFGQATQTKKATFTYPALKNHYYLVETDSEITLDKLFEPA
jgi:hypothetical protein